MKFTKLVKADENADNSWNDVLREQLTSLQTIQRISKRIISSLQYRLASIGNGHDKYFSTGLKDEQVRLDNERKVAESLNKIANELKELLGDY